MNTWTKFIAATALAAVASTAQAGELTIYTALEEEEVAEYIKAAQEALPGVQLNVLRLSTGKLGARLLAEADNPQADLIWGWAVTAMMDPQVLALLEPYKAKGADVLGAEFRDAENHWFAPIGYMGAFCVNTDRLAKLGLDMPKSWKDLEAEGFKGEVVMPDPNQSGTGYLHVNAVLQSLGADAGWAQLEAVDPNIAQYTSSGSKPCKAARAGEYAVGISLAFTGIDSIESGYPVEIVFPEGGVGYELEASGLMASSDNKEDARKFLDWTMSDSAIAMYQDFKALITIPGIEGDKKPGLPDDVSTILAPVDFVNSADNQTATKATWAEKFAR